MYRCNIVTQYRLTRTFQLLYDVTLCNTPYQKYVSKNGGLFGGWDEYDHQMFIKAFNRSKVIISK